MQSLDVISLNLLQILISLLNLVILFLILKKFLYAPVKRVLMQRESDLSKQYDDAEKAQNQADLNLKKWEEKLNGANEQADIIIKKAGEKAQSHSNRIILDAREKADTIVRDAEAQAKLTHKKAESEIKREIADVSVSLTEKILSRNISEDEHHRIIDSVISEIGEHNDSDK